jgi:hypothetical protein
LDNATCSHEGGTERPGVQAIKLGFDRCSRGVVVVPVPVSVLWPVLT